MITNKIKQAKLLISTGGYCFDTTNDYMLCTDCSFSFFCNKVGMNNNQLMNEANIILHKHRESKLKRILND